MNDQSTQKICDLIIGISLGDFDSKIAPLKSEEMNAIVTGIYMLSEELKSTTVSRNYFNNIFHSVSDMIFVLNFEGKIIQVNNSVMQLLSCSETELINTSINKLFPETQNEIFKEVSDQFQNDCKIVSLSTLMKYKKEAIDTHCVFSHLHSKQNEDIGFMLIARDIRKIKQYETKYQKIFQESSDAIFIMDKNYQLLEINNACKQLINQEIEMPSILDLFADASEKINFEKGLKKNNKIKDFNTKLKVRSDDEINCLISVSRLEEKSGNFQGIIKDISTQKANEAHIINTIIQTEANERKRIAADLHDSLGQQLSAILFYIGTIKGNKKISPENLAEILEKSHNGISNSIQELRNICFNIMPRTLENYDLIEAIKEMCFKIEMQNILKFDISFPKVKMSLPKNLELTLFRIIQEFVNNTIKHANAKSIKIKISLKKGCLHIEILDNGCGFDFQKTYSITGLGLKNMESRLLPFNGKLLFSSKSNKGTCCTIVIDKHYLKDNKS